MKIQVIAVAYERPIPLQILIGCFMVQTNPNWMLHIVYDGPAPQEITNIVAPFIEADKERVHFYQSAERYQQYGHPNRSSMLQSIVTEPNDYILMTNDDNYYVPLFVDFMLASVHRDEGIVYCDTIHSHLAYDLHISELRENHIDIGAFMVRADIAKTVGFNHVHFSADGTYAEECLRYCQKRSINVIKVKKPLFIHN